MAGQREGGGIKRTALMRGGQIKPKIFWDNHTGYFSKLCR